MSRIPPFAPIPAPNASDGPEAANKLKQTIEAAWREQGRRVSCRVQTAQAAGRPIYEIRSDLVNGLPRELPAHCRTYPGTAAREVPETPARKLIEGRIWAY